MMDEAKKTSAFPMKPDGEVDKDEAKRLYMRSIHVAWTPFAQEIGWHLDDSRHHFPTVKWVREKRFNLAKQQAEEMTVLLDQARPLIRKDMLRTLTEYPKSHDSLHDCLNLTIAHLKHEVVEMVKAGQARRIAQMTTEPPRKGLVWDLQMCVNALMTLTNSKHKSLLLTEVSFKAMSEQTQSEQTQETAKGEETEQLKFEVMGFEGIQPNQYEQYFSQFLDPPRKPVIDIEIQPDPPDEESTP